MSNIRNMNQVNPFWDFIASLQDPSNQAMFAQQHRGPPDHEENEDADAFDGHWAGAWGPFGGPPGGRGFGSRSGHGHGPRGGRRGPPPPPEHEGFEHDHESHDRRSRRGPPHGPPPPHHEGGPRGPPPPHGPPLPHQGRGPSPPPPPPPPFAEDPPSRSPTPPPPPPGFEAPESHHAGHHGPPPHHRRGGRCGGRGGHGHGPHGHGAHGHGSRRGGPRGPFGGPRHGGPGFMGGAPFDLSALAEAFAPGLFAGNNNNNNNNGNSAASRNGPAEDGTFSLEVDVFDTPAAYIIHGSLPGAKKSDLSITYSAQRSSVCISGVVTRPDVDEELMATLALDERKVGSFEREIKLERGVQIEEDRIGAKLEDGVLRVTVPKVQLLEDSEEEYVDVKKVELE